MNLKLNAKPDNTIEKHLHNRNKSLSKRKDKSNKYTNIVSSIKGKNLNYQISIKSGRYTKKWKNTTMMNLRDYERQLSDRKAKWKIGLLKGMVIIYS